MLHGWGANQHDLVPLAQSLKLENCQSFFPNAPYDVLGTGGAGKGWFTFPLNENSEQEKEASRETLFSHLDEIQGKGFRADQIVLLGFSQGAGMCLDLMLNWTKKVSAVVSLRGFLMDEEGAKKRRDSLPTDIPVFAAHGLYDSILPLERSKASVQILEECGFNLTWREYRMAHQIVPDEIDDIRMFINRMA